MLTYSDGTPVTGRITDSDLALEPRSLGIIAYYDGWSQATSKAPPSVYPRRLTAAEAAQWREGWAEGRAARTPGRDHD